MTHWRIGMVSTCAMTFSQDQSRPRRKLNAENEGECGRRRKPLTVVVVQCVSLQPEA